MTKPKSVARQQLIHDIICCPTCHLPPKYIKTSSYNHMLVAGEIVCAGCGPIGSICNTKYIFNDNPAFICSEDENNADGLQERIRLLDQSMCFPAINWQFDNGRYWTDHPGACFRLDTTAIGVNIGLLKHSWAGKIHIRINGRDLGIIDLFEENGSLDIVIPVYIGTGSHIIEVILADTSNPKSASNQCHVVAMTELMATGGVDGGYEYIPVNRGNPYPEIWPDLINGMRPDALILDCGAGDRRYPDDRVINFEYSAFDAPEVFGDGHKLPFKANTFDLILSQAVIEHLYNPFDAVEEIRRVLKPDGIVYAESAFMQPLHAVPFHFFNTTRWGMEKLFENYAIERVCSGGDSFSTTLEWIYSLTKLREKGRGAQLDQLLNIARELDAEIASSELDKFASFITVIARKRPE